MTDQNNEITPAQQEALAAYAPPPGYIHPGTYTTQWTPEKWQQLCSRYASGETPITLAKEFKLPLSLIWRWSAMPGLAEIWATARKDYSHSLIAKAGQALDDMMSGAWAANVADPAKGELAARMRAMGDATKLAMELAAKVNPDEYSDRLQIDKRSVAAVYVVAYDAGQQIGHEPASIDVSAIPAPDKAGVERAKLTQSWRKAIAKERRLKLKQLASTDT